MHWDGTGWTQSPTPSADGGSALAGVSAAASDDVWSVGYSYGFATKATLALHWDGTSWSQVATASPGVNSSFSAVSALSSTDVWAVGTDDMRNGDGLSLVEHWDGTAWTQFPTPSPGADSNDLNSVTAISATDVWAVGTTSDTFDGKVHTFTLHWDGTSWALVSSPDPGRGRGGSSYLFGVTGNSSDDVWAAGMYVDTSVPKTLVEHWDGTRWTQVPSPSPPPRHTGWLTSVSATSSTDVWAVGHFAVDGNTDHTLIEHWDGNVWKRVSSPNHEGKNFCYLDAVTAEGSSDAWAVGYYPNRTATRDNVYMVHWDGTSWQ